MCSYQFLYCIYCGNDFTPFCSRRCFLTQPHCCLTFVWIELQMLLRCSLIYIPIIILRHLLYLVYLCSICVISLWSIICSQPRFQCHLSHYGTKTVALVFCTFLECLVLFLVDNVDEKSKQFWNSESSS